MAGIAHSELGHFDQALQHFARNVALAPDRATCWANLGMLLKTTGALAAGFGRL